MSTRYIISTTPEAIESKFALPPQSIIIENNYNISPGQFAPVITNEKPYEIQLFKFGLTPFYTEARQVKSTLRHWKLHNIQWLWPDLKTKKSDS